MRKILMICALVWGMLLVSCHQDEDNIFTTAAIELQSADDITIERVQGTVTLTNLNTKQVITSAEFNGNTATVQVLRGAYTALIEGSIQYRDASGTVAIRQFRATADYLALEKENINTATLNITWL